MASLPFRNIPWKKQRTNENNNCEKPEIPHFKNRVLRQNEVLLHVGLRLFSLDTYHKLALLRTKDDIGLLIKHLYIVKVIKPQIQNLYITMNFLIKLVLTALAVIIAAYFLPGVSVDSFLIAVLVAVVLAVLNAILKPVLILLTIPLTILTLGLFLLVINAIIILLAEYLIPGFHVEGFWWALIFSLILSVLVSVFEALTGGITKD